MWYGGLLTFLAQCDACSCRMAGWRWWTSQRWGGRGLCICFLTDLLPNREMFLASSRETSVNSLVSCFFFLSDGENEAVRKSSKTFSPAPLQVNATIDNLRGTVHPKIESQSLFAHLHTDKDSVSFVCVWTSSCSFYNALKVKCISKCWYFMASSFSRI